MGMLVAWRLQHGTEMPIGLTEGGLLLETVERVQRGPFSSLNASAET